MTKKVINKNGFVSYFYKGGRGGGGGVRIKGFNIVRIH